MRETADVLGRLAALETELARLRTLVSMRLRSTSDAALPPHEQAGAEPSASRRDLLRYGAVALGAAAAAGMAASPVEAADGGPIIIGGQQQHRHRRRHGVYVTVLRQQVALVGVLLACTGRAQRSAGLRVSSSSGQAGVSARSANPASTASRSRQRLRVTRSTSAVRASTAGRIHRSAPECTATLSRPTRRPSTAGMRPAATPMRAEVPSIATDNAIAMYALNYSTYTGGGPGAGGFAIYGLSAKGHGLVGATAAAGAAAVVGATNGVAGAYAAAFYGPVIVGGDFTVVGGAKSAAVPHPDGSHRRLYCVESPESWFEDFGRGRAGLR